MKRCAAASVLLLCGLLRAGGQDASAAEQTRWLQFEPGVRVCIRTPNRVAAETNRPWTLIFYAVPNGNTIEQTLGRKPRAGQDWHFDIQHIAAQTRFLRERMRDRELALICLENDLKSWPAWRRRHGDGRIGALLEQIAGSLGVARAEWVLTGHSGGGSLTFGFLDTVTNIPSRVSRIAFLDSDYAYDSARGHGEKLARWLRASPSHCLCVLAYDDAAALLDGKPFVSAEGGTWGRSRAMLRDLEAHFAFRRERVGPLEKAVALDGRIEFLLRHNPERKVWHTVLVERNGFIQAMLSGTPLEGRGYEYLGPRAYERWIAEE
jgi:hypothetical protein